MNFRDRHASCETCGKTYVFTVTQQRQLYEAGKAVLDPDSNEPVAPRECSSCRMRDPESGRWSGSVKWFNAEKGYGFIAKPNSDEVFFHRTQVDSADLVNLDEGAVVTFEEISTDRGAEARNVKVES